LSVWAPWIVDPRGPCHVNIGVVGQSQATLVTLAHLGNGVLLALQRVDLGFLDHHAVAHLTLTNYSDIHVGDEVQCYEMVEKPRD
jgi:hypothetical protein